MMRELVGKNRSYRRFHEGYALESNLLRDLVDLARLSGSGGNLQPLKYVISCETGLNDEIFNCLRWAGYLEDWPGPPKGERPGGYIVILCDTAIAKSPGCDHGIAAQTILLAAVEKELGGCMIGNIDREQLRKVLQIPEQYDIALVVALGKPKEDIIIDPVGENGSIKYWREADGTHHVPKRPLDEVLVSFHTS